MESTWDPVKPVALALVIQSVCDKGTKLAVPMGYEREPDENQVSSIRRLQVGLGGFRHLHGGQSVDS